MRVVFLRIITLKLRTGSRQKLKRCSFNYLYNSNMITVVGLTVSETDRGKMSDGSGHKELDYKLLICNLGLRNILLKLSVY